MRAIRKTPIVVNDSRGFYTSRVVGTYLREGHLMLTEGVPAAMIENVGRMAGMPVGPLALNDEVAVDLAWKILKATEADLGADRRSTRGKRRCSRRWWRSAAATAARTARAFTTIRKTRRSDCGPASPTCKPNKLDPDTIDVEELKHRLLVIQALETARCIEEDVVTDVREADVGSILGFGFAPFTGGTISYIDGMGAKAFVDLCEAACEDLWRALQAVQALARHGEKGRDILRPLPAAAAQSRRMTDRIALCRAPRVRSRPISSRDPAWRVIKST